MQYVGRFVSSVYNTITPNINPATLSGAIDVIVVERQIEVEVEENSGWGGGEKVKKKIMTTELASTPFHVRFGKMSVLRPAERKVTLHLNSSSEPLPFAMKIGEEGEAFFVLELGEDEINGGIPDDLVTSPILSAAPSPLVAAEQSDKMSEQDGEATASTSDLQADSHRAPRKFIQEDYVEPLDLGASRAATSNYLNSDLESNEASTIRSGETRASIDTGITSLDLDGANPNGEAAEAASRPAKENGGEDNTQQDDNTGMFGSLEEAASKAGGAIGAAGRSMLPSLGGGSKKDAKLEKVVKRAEKEGLNLEDKLTGASKDEKSESKSAHRYEPTKASEGVSRMQRQDDGHPPDDIAEAKTETDELEVRMRDRAKDLVTKTVQARQERSNSKENSQAKSQIRKDSKGSLDLQEEAYPAPFGSSGATLASTETAPTTQSDHAAFLAGMKIDPVDSGVTGTKALFPAQVDSRTVRGRLRKYEEERAKDFVEEKGPVDLQVEKQNEVGEGKVEDSEVASKVSGRKENLQYMLDMDGYKMTADGEDLAFAEGHRFANELPLSRRHGGGGAQGHDEVLSHPHQHTINQMSHLQKSGEQISPSVFRRGSLGDVNIKPPSIGREGHKRRGSHSAATSDAGDTMPFGEESRSASVVHERDALALSRDLVRLTRSLRTGNAHPEADPLGAPRRSQRRHQDASLSDNEVDTGDSAHSRHIRATSEEAPTRFGDESPPIVRDDTALGRNPDYEWGWGQLPKRDINAALHANRRHRVLSSPDLLDEAGASNPEGHSSEGRLVCDEQDPYRFILELEDATHSFELSLCYVDGIGEASSAVTDIEAGAVEGEKANDWTYHFDENKVSYQRFLDDEEVVNDERVVIRYNDRLLTWENASAVLATLSLYRKTLSVSIQDGQASAKGQSTTDVPQLGQRASVWKRWWNRNKESIDSGAVAGDLEAAHPIGSNGDSAETPQPGLDRSNTDSLLHTKPKPDQKRASSAATVPITDTQAKDKSKKTKTYAKTLRLTSDQLKTLNLRKGANSITFSVTSSYSGVATCTARIFLWDANHQIVVSDIDGTITKSDALGHVFTMIGRDWTHIGVAKLYTDIARNGYRIMYLTSRAIGQADTTRDYLKGIRQNNYKLPDGPVIMSPDRLMASLHREVILRKPEVFKMACLRDIARLFGADPRNVLPQPGGTDLIKFNKEALDASNGPGAGKAQSPAQGAATVSKSNEQHASPFYAGFGNRITDALSYRSVNIPSSRIFTIDSNGEVKMELLELAGYKSSYIHMTDLVDQMFPPITLKSAQGNEGKPEFNDFNYWRPEIEQFELPPDDELMPSPVNSSPTSPALSARSVKSNASLRSRASRSPQAEGHLTASSRDDGNYNNGEEVSSSRLSRFGLGKLGMSRKNSSSSAQTLPAQGIAASDDTALSARKSSNGSASVFAVSSNRSTSDLSAFNTSSATLPNTKSEQSNYAQTPSSPSSYGSGVTSWAASWRRRATSPGASATNGNANGAQATSPLVGPVITAEPDEDDSGEGEEDDDVSSIEEEEEGIGNQEDVGDDVLEDDDPLLATGEIRFEWRG